MSSGQSDSALERETTGDGLVDVDALDTTWKIPTRRHLKHLQSMQSGLAAPGVSASLVIARVFLDPGVSAANLQEPDQWRALLELDPAEPELDDLVNKIGDALGLGDSGN